MASDYGVEAGSPLVPPVPKVDHRSTQSEKRLSISPDVLEQIGAAADVHIISMQNIEGIGMARLKDNVVGATLTDHCEYDFLDLVVDAGLRAQGVWAMITQVVAAGAYPCTGAQGRRCAEVEQDSRIEKLDKTILLFCQSPDQ